MDANTYKTNHIDDDDDDHHHHHHSDDDGDDDNEGEISARQQISRKFQLPTNFGEVLTDGQTRLINY